MLEKREYLNQTTIKKDVSHLLTTAFPEDERPPVSYFFKSLEKKENHLFAYYSSNEFIGFTFITLYQDICYIFFLAVSEGKRHQGYGGEILEEIKKTYHDCVILLCYEEVDPKYPDYENRQRREKFYVSHGFEDNYLKTNEFGVIFQTAYIGKHHVDINEYVEIFVLGFGEHCRKHVKKAE